MEVLILKPNYYSYGTKTYLGFKKAALLAVIKLPLEKNNLKNIVLLLCFLHFS